MEAPRLGIVYSTGDPAGSGAAARLLRILGPGEPCGPRCSRYPWGLVAGFEAETVEMEFLDHTLPNVDAYIVLSRHASTSGRPTLSLHYPGNPGDEARLGGRPRELSYTWPRLLSLLARLYHREAEERGLLSRYSFSLEATHHGPTGLKRPIVFIEIGSTPDKWEDPEAQEAMASAVAEAARLLSERGVAALPTGCRIAIGVGGTHYPEKHTRLLLEGRFCYGHIFAKYVLTALTEEVLAEAVEKSLDRVEGFVVLKIPGRVRRMVEAFASGRGLEVWRNP